MTSQDPTCCHTPDTNHDLSDASANFVKKEPSKMESIQSIDFQDSNDQEKTSNAQDNAGNSGGIPKSEPCLTEPEYEGKPDVIVKHVLREKPQPQQTQQAFLKLPIILSTTETPRMTTQAMPSPIHLTGNKQNEAKRQQKQLLERPLWTSSVDHVHAAKLMSKNIKILPKPPLNLNKKTIYCIPNPKMALTTIPKSNTSLPKPFLQTTFGVSSNQSLNSHSNREKTSEIIAGVSHGNGGSGMPIGIGNNVVLNYNNPQLVRFNSPVSQAVQSQVNQAPPPVTGPVVLNSLTQQTFCPFPSVPVINVPVPIGGVPNGLTVAPHNHQLNYVDGLGQIASSSIPPIMAPSMLSTTLSNTYLVPQPLSQSNTISKQAVAVTVSHVATPINYSKPNQSPCNVKPMLITIGSMSSLMKAALPTLTQMLPTTTLQQAAPVPIGTVNIDKNPKLSSLSDFYTQSISRENTCTQPTVHSLVTSASSNIEGTLSAHTKSKQSTLTTRDYTLTNRYFSSTDESQVQNVQIGDRPVPLSISSHASQVLGLLAAHSSINSGSNPNAVNNNLSASCYAMQPISSVNTFPASLKAALSAPSAPQIQRMETQMPFLSSSKSMLIGDEDKNEKEMMSTKSCIARNSLVHQKMQTSQNESCWNDPSPSKRRSVVQSVQPSIIKAGKEYSCASLPASTVSQSFTETAQTSEVNFTQRELKLQESLSAVQPAVNTQLILKDTQLRFILPKEGSKLNGLVTERTTGREDENDERTSAVLLGPLTLTGNQVKVKDLLDIQRCFKDRIQRRNLRSTKPSSCAKSITFSSTIPQAHSSSVSNSSVSKTIQRLDALSFASFSNKSNGNTSTSTIRIVDKPRLSSVSDSVFMSDVAKLSSKKAQSNSNSHYLSNNDDKKSRTDDALLRLSFHGDIGTLMDSLRECSVPLKRIREGKTNVMETDFKKGRKRERCKYESDDESLTRRSADSYSYLGTSMEEADKIYKKYKMVNEENCSETSETDSCNRKSNINSVQMVKKGWKFDSLRHKFIEVDIMENSEDIWTLKLNDDDLMTSSRQTVNKKAHASNHSISSNENIDGVRFSETASPAVILKTEPSSPSSDTPSSVASNTLQNHTMSPVLSSDVTDVKFDIIGSSSIMSESELMTTDTSKSNISDSESESTVGEKSRNHFLFSPPPELPVNSNATIATQPDIADCDIKMEIDVDDVHDQNEPSIFNKVTPEDEGYHFSSEDEADVFEDEDGNDLTKMDKEERKHIVIKRRNEKTMFILQNADRFSVQTDGNYRCNMCKVYHSNGLFRISKHLRKHFQNLV